MSERLIPLPIADDLSKPQPMPPTSLGGFRIGVLTNPRSGGNRKGHGGIDEFLCRQPDISHLQAVTPAEITACLYSFAARDIDLLVINGGDGTVQAALTALFHQTIFAKRPLLALLRAGTSSMLARDVGMKGTPLETLRKIIAWGKSAHVAAGDIVSRPILRVLRPGGAPPVCGMFFGTGAICRGIELSHSRINPKGIRGELMPGLILGRLVLALLTGDRKRVPAIPLTIRLAEQQLTQSHYLFALVTTLERLFLGLTPFWGTQDAPLRFTALGPAPSKLLRCIPALLRGRKHRLITENNDYFSSNNEQVEMTLDGLFTLDGELFRCAGPLRIEPVGPINFLRLQSA